MRAFLFLSLGLLTASTACRRHHGTYTSPPAASAPNTFVPGTFIENSGHWTHSDGFYLSITLTTNVSAHAVEFELQRVGKDGGGGSSGTMPVADPADPWFIYVETLERVWTFDGSNKLDYMIVDANGSRSGVAVLDGKVQEGAPAVPIELAPRLPEDIRNALPYLNRPETIPSY